MPSLFSWPPCANIVTVTKLKTILSAEVVPAPVKRGRGRPPKGVRPMSGAERTARYRGHKLDDQVLEPLACLERVNLMEMLARDLRLIEEYQKGRGAPDASLIPDLLDGARDTAGKVVAEIVRRFGLKVPRRR